MKNERAWMIQTLLIVVILNGILLAAVNWATGEMLQERGLLIGYWLLGVVITLLIWLAVVNVERRFAARSSVETLPPTETKHPSAGPAQPAAQPPSTPAVSAERGAVQILAVLQREGRLIDFLQENLDQYEDAQIGAAVRTIHAGSRHALDEHMGLQPIFTESEGSTVTVPRGFDAHAIRLSGDVAGEPPFTGVLRHRGWRAEHVDLPATVEEKDAPAIVAPAEVEIGG